MGSLSQYSAVHTELLMSSNDQSRPQKGSVGHSVMSNSLPPHGLYVACQAPLSMGFSRQEYWSGLLFPFPGIFLTQGSNLHLLCLLHWQWDSLPLHHLEIRIMLFCDDQIKPIISELYY